MLMNYDVSTLWSEGYQVVRGFYSDAEMAIIRQELDKHRKCGRNPSLDDARELLSIVFNKEFLSLAQQVISDDDVVVFSDVAVNAIDRFDSFGWHKDNIDRFCASGQDWSEGYYPIVRFGIYLDDYTTASQGLGVQVGSHRGVLYNNPGVPVKTRPGDIVFWPLTTTHTANTPRFFWSKDSAPVLPFKIESNVGGVVQRLCYKGIRTLARIPGMTTPRNDTRQAIFLTIGRRSDVLARYIAYLLHREYYYKANVGLKVCDPLRFISSRGYKVFDPGVFLSQISVDDLMKDFSEGAIRTLDAKLTSLSRNILGAI